jgi:long-chain fatty acid transport protein
VTVISFAGGAAQATEGYFQYGYGARQGGLAGAGVADSRDAMALSLNPAGLVDVGRQSSTASKQNDFVVPNIAYSSPIDADSAWGLAV